MYLERREIPERIFISFEQEFNEEFEYVLDEEGVPREDIHQFLNKN
jgi:hypothetical protein